MPNVMQTLDENDVVHRLCEAADRAVLLAEHGSRIRGIATDRSVGADAALLDQLPTFSPWDSVVLAPHAASGTVETRAAMGQLVIDNLAAHFAGKPLLTPYPNLSFQAAA